MPGRLPGRFFKLAVSNMLDDASTAVSSQVRRRIAEMQPDALYAWDDFTDLMQTIAAKLPPATLVAIGARIITESHAQYVERGFTTVEQVLGDWGALFNGFIHGAPARDLVRTESFAKGRVVVIAGIAQPASLVEGYMRGVVDAYQAGTVTSCEITPFISGGANYNRIVMTWTSR